MVRRWRLILIQRTSLVQSMVRWSRRWSVIRDCPSAGWSCSWRGFHLHILDDNVLWWTRKKRLAFANALIRKGFVMDEWVTAGGIRMIRLPYSLNGLVSRIALPLEPSELECFDPLMDPRVIPKFLRGKA